MEYQARAFPNQNSFVLARLAVDSVLSIRETVRDLVGILEEVKLYQEVN